MIEFKLPALGADMDEGTLLEWKVQAGDAVKKGQVVAVVDTTKAAVDVECWQDGTVHELVAQPGDKMPVGTLMATLLEPGEQPGAKVSRGGTPPPRRMVSPAARKAAAERGVDLGRVAGTGPQGAVTLEDVEKAAPGIAPPTDKAAEMRKAIAAAMARSKREIPHYYVAEDIVLAKALAWLQAANATRPMAERLLPAALLLKAVAVTLKRYPELNGHWRDGAYQPAAQVNLGVAISLRQGGLIAPALLDAGSKPLTQLMQEMTDLVARARAGSLRSSELGEGTITVTNLGDQGSEAVFGIIYPPQVALVGFGRIAERPVVEDGAVKPLAVVSASLAADHRVSDGHRGALFLRDLADLLQRPEEIDQ
ncbi:MAG: 2-oxo acid dehydrogenase subunit E2 [Rhodocyclales bacterium]|nr:2-oxo acid dehydrogenase subunit E2 [Rhodocyclales bacterium]